MMMIRTPCSQRRPSNCRHFAAVRLPCLPVVPISFWLSWLLCQTGGLPLHTSQHLQLGAAVRTSATTIGSTRISGTAGIARRKTRAQLWRRKALPVVRTMTNSAATGTGAADGVMREDGATVAVLGAGSAGLCAGRLLREEGCRVTIFEKSDHLGGVWRYRPDPQAAAPMYRSLVTNLPKEIMSFLGFPFPEDLNSFPTHAQVLDYLKSYSEEYSVGPLVRWGCEIVSVRPLLPQPTAAVVGGSEHSQVNNDVAGNSDAAAADTGDPFCSAGEQQAVEEGSSRTGAKRNGVRTVVGDHHPRVEAPACGDAGAQAEHGKEEEGKCRGMGGERNTRAVGKWEVIYFERITSSNDGGKAKLNRRNGSRQNGHKVNDIGGSDSSVSAATTTKKTSNGVGHHHRHYHHRQQQAETKAPDEFVKRTQIFDAVCVCTGHYEKPFTPKTEGWDRFEGTSMHARAYDRPEVDAFVGKRVLCVGSRSSGTDVAREVSSVASIVNVCDRAAATSREGGGEHGNVCWRPALVRFEGSNGVRFKDGTVAEVDTVVWCTGYNYSFPFLEGSGLLTPPVSERVHPLYEHVFHVLHPSLTFIGLPQSIVPFPMFDLQVNAVAAAISGRMQLASRADREQWLLAEEKKMFEERGVDPASRGVHVMKARQWPYLRHLLQLAKGPGAILAGKREDAAQHGNKSASGSNGFVEGNDIGGGGGGVGPDDQRDDETAIASAIYEGEASVSTQSTAANTTTVAAAAKAEKHMNEILKMLKVRETVYNDTGYSRPTFPGGPDDYRRRLYHIDSDSGKFSVTMAARKANGEGPSSRVSSASAVVEGAATEAAAGALPAAEGATST